MRTDRSERAYRRSVKNAKRLGLVGMLILFTDQLSYGSLLSGAPGFLGLIGLAGVFGGMVMLQFAKYRSGRIDKLYYWLIFDAVLLGATLYIWYGLL